MSNLYLVFFLIGAILFLMIVLYSIYKKRQSDWHVNSDTSSYIDSSDTSGEYLKASPEQENETIEPSFRLDGTKLDLDQGKSEIKKAPKLSESKLSRSESSEPEASEAKLSELKSSTEPKLNKPKLNKLESNGFKLSKTKKVIQPEVELPSKSVTDSSESVKANLDLEKKPIRVVKNKAEIKPKLDPSSSTLITELVAKIKNPLPIEQQELLTQFRLHDFKFNRKVHLFGLNQLTENWQDIEFELPSARFVELGLSIQLADRDGAMAEKELHDFQQMVLEFTNKFDAPFEFSMPIDDAFDQGQALDAIGRRYDSMAVLNIVSKTQGGFRVADLGSCARDLMMSSDKKGIYLKTIGQKDDISILYRLAITDGAGNLLPSDSVTAVSHDLVLYMNVPATSEPQKVFQEMVKDANSLASWLEGKVVDRNRHNMTDHSYSVLMQQIVDITANMKKDGLSPGDAVSKMLF